MVFPPRSPARVDQAAAGLQDYEVQYSITAPRSGVHPQDISSALIRRDVRCRACLGFYGVFAWGRRPITTRARDRNVVARLAGPRSNFPRSSTCDSAVPTGQEEHVKWIALKTISGSTSAPAEPFANH